MSERHCKWCQRRHAERDLEVCITVARGEFAYYSKQAAEASKKAEKAADRIWQLIRAESDALLAVKGGNR